MLLDCDHPHLKLVEDLPPEPVPESKPSSKVAEAVKGLVSGLTDSRLDRLRLEACGLVLEEKLKPTKAAEAMRAWFRGHVDGEGIGSLKEAVLGLADEVDFVARVDGLPASEFMREAIAAHIADRRSDPEFRERLRERMNADQQILDRLMPPEWVQGATK